MSDLTTRLIQSQKDAWSNGLRNYNWKKKKVYGYEWGNPNIANDKLGNYLAVKQYLLENIHEYSVIAEVGSLAGKWIQFFLYAKEIICVDIIPDGFDYIRLKFPQDNIRFYLTRGDELEGITSDSVDVIYSMDSLMRTNEHIILSYLKDGFRVLRHDGVLMYHLPCDLLPMCFLKSFLRLSYDDIIRLVDQSGFKDYEIDTKTLRHGVLVKARKA
jgi:SAM-dependent methyltransferase